MKISNIPLISTTMDMSGSFDLDPIYLGNILVYSIQLSFTGSPIGTFALQCSDDPGLINSPGKTAQSSTVSIWTDVGDSEQDITTGGNHSWNVQNAGYSWVRVKYTSASGTGTLVTARATVKGA